MLLVQARKRNRDDVLFGGMGVTSSSHFPALVRLHVAASSRLGGVGADNGAVDNGDGGDDDISREGVVKLGPGLRRRRRTLPSLQQNLQNDDNNQTIESRRLMCPFFVLSSSSLVCKPATSTSLSTERYVVSLNILSQEFSTSLCTALPKYRTV